MKEHWYHHNHLHFFFSLCNWSSPFPINRGLNVNQQLKPRIAWWHYRQWQCSCTELLGHLPSSCSTNLNLVSTKIWWKGCYSLRLPVLLMRYKLNLQYSSYEVHYFTALFKMKWEKKEKDQCLATCTEGITE